MNITWFAEPDGTVDWPLRVYRTIAYTVGVFLPILLVGAIYGLATAHGAGWRVAAGRPTVVKVIGPLHGFLYIVLLLMVLTMSLRERWNPVFTVLVGLSGTIPFLSFVAEHFVTKRVRARRAASRPGPVAPEAAGAASRPPTGR
jgi:integral membrane protein